MSDAGLAQVRADERDLVARAQAGDEAALDALVASHTRAVYQVTYRILGDPELAADAAQDTFVRAVRGLPGFQGESSFRTWLLRIAANTARSAGRWKTRRREVALEMAGPSPAPGPSPEQRALTQVEAERVTRALARLPEKQRLAVSLRVYEDMSHREIGAVIGSSETAARVNYHLGIRKLREWLA